MAQRINPKEKINQRSIGFHLRQILFFAEHERFQPDKHCRRIIDDQIAEINPAYLADTDPRKI